MEDRQVSLKQMLDAVDEMPVVKDNNGIEFIMKSLAKMRIGLLPSAQPDNQVHLCDSCKHTYPDCPSQNDDVIFGNGNGDDNICACAKYAPSAQPEIIRCAECKWFQCNMRQDGYLPKGVDEFECRHWCGYCDPTDFCSYAERRTNG